MAAIHWTEKELALLQEQYPGTKSEEVAALLGKSKKAVTQKANALGLAKSKEFTRLNASMAANVRHGKPALPTTKLPPVNHKELERPGALAAQLRGLAYDNPLRQAYLKLTAPGTKAGTAPRTMAQLKAYCHV